MRDNRVGGFSGMVGSNIWIPDSFIKSNIQEKAVREW